VAQLAKHPTLAFGSGHDPQGCEVMRLSPALGSLLGMEHA